MIAWEVTVAAMVLGKCRRNMKSGGKADLAKKNDFDATFILFEIDLHKIIQATSKNIVDEQAKLQFLSCFQ